MPGFQLKRIPTAKLCNNEQRLNLLDLFKEKQTVDTEWKVDSILQQGYPINQPLCLETNQTLLMMCANNQNGHIKVFQRVLCYNPDLNMKDNNGRTVLHFCARAGKEKELKLLLAAKDLDLNA